MVPHQEALLFLLSAYVLPPGALPPRAPLPLFRPNVALEPARPGEPARHGGGTRAVEHAVPGFSPDLTAALLTKDQTNSFSIMLPLLNGESSHVFECNLCGHLKKEDDVPQGSDSSMAD
ncbi:hypothetical protein GUJ93_ZPchr0008g14080 [Zizania palustris]|uniref:Uncharacterized protein n=1 Tax=Zizania palustris TaxID=103762 RepID=A0A8J5R6F3_ZIZPA|nr:hypothetical protein GUJ93_ZPchr0008g14080 [Zizania palustris]